MRKAWMMSILTVGCLIGIPGCYSSSILASVATEAAFTAVSTILATWFSGLLGTATSAS
jgi:hypothetical protein